MSNNSKSKLGGICAIIVAVLYILIGITFLLIPADQKAAYNPDELARYYASYNQSPGFTTLLWVEFALIALIAFPVVAGVYKMVRTVNETWAQWMSALACLGLAAVAIEYFRYMAIIPWRAEAFVAGGTAIRETLAGSNTSLDHHGWLRFGALGAWIIGVSIIALSGKKFPLILGILGIVVGILSSLVLLGNVLEIVTLVSITAVAGGIVLGPVWYVWIGVRLLRE